MDFEREMVLLRAEIKSNFNAINEEISGLRRGVSRLSKRIGSLQTIVEQGFNVVALKVGELDGDLADVKNRVAKLEEKSA